MPELQLNPKKTALVLIDLNNAILGQNTAPYTAMQVVANSKKLAEAPKPSVPPELRLSM
jgi:hypothetical protein